MKGTRLLIDTTFVQALLNPRDQYHARAVAARARRRGAELWVTEYVLVEIGDGLCRLDRRAAATFIEACYQAPDTRVVAAESRLLRDGLTLYGARPDKEWSLTDCSSMAVIRENALTDVLTADHHFRQAGFRALLLEGP